MQFRGMYAAAVTPFAANDVPDEAALWRHLEMLVAAGIDGICIGGSTGEFTRMDNAARQRLLRTALEIVAGRVPVLAGAGHVSLDGTLALVAGAGEAGAAAALVPPPYYFPYGQPELLTFYRCVSATADLPVFIYNIPQFTNPVEPATACELLARGTCAGIKDSSGRAAMLETLAAERGRSSFVFFCGNDECLLRALGLGADGGLSGVAACAPELLIALYRAFRAGDERRAGECHALLLQFIRRIEAFPPPIGIRLALEARGIPVGPHAIPLAAETQAEARQFRLWLEEWLPLAQASDSRFRAPGPA